MTTNRPEREVLADLLRAGLITPKDYARAMERMDNPSPFAWSTWRTRDPREPCDHVAAMATSGPCPVCQREVAQPTWRPDAQSVPRSMLPIVTTLRKHSRICPTCGSSVAIGLGCSVCVETPGPMAIVVRQPSLLQRVIDRVAAWLRVRMGVRG